MKTPELLRTVAIACAFASASACNRTPTDADARQAADEIKTTASRAGGELKDAASHAGDQLADSWITTKIQAQYFADNDIKARYINVSTRDGKVTLSGRVENQNAHDQALQTAKNTDGVHEVTDRLTVGPAVEAAARGVPERMDSAWIATKIQAKYFADPGVTSRDINVSAANGIVTLSGRVVSDQEKQQAVMIARNTDGVTQVEDRLTVQAAGGTVATTGSAPAEIGRSAVSPMDEARITSTIQSKYFLDDMVKGRRINVDTRQGVVTLRGEVGSEAERGQALLLARTTEGVQRVEDNLSVAVVPAAPAAKDMPLAPNASATARDSSASANAATSAAAAPRADDEMLTTKIQSKFFLDNRLRGGTIDVTAKDGVVLLQGTIPNETARKQALSIARSTDGVVQVVDRLKVGKR
jgi:hyperosmotically inducible protein